MALDGIPIRHVNATAALNITNTLTFIVRQFRHIPQAAIGNCIIVHNYFPSSSATLRISVHSKLMAVPGS
jgi:hypothetical protein